MCVSVYLCIYKQSTFFTYIHTHTHTHTHRWSTLRNSPLRPPWSPMTSPHSSTPVAPPVRYISMCVCIDIFYIDIFIIQTSIHLYRFIHTHTHTGTPKGVKLTHRNLTSDVKGMGLVIPDDAIPVSRSVAFLPWAHCEYTCVCECVYIALHVKSDYIPKTNSFTLTCILFCT